MSDVRRLAFSAAYEAEKAAREIPQTLTVDALAAIREAINKANASTMRTLEWLDKVEI